MSIHRRKSGGGAGRAAALAAALLLAAARPGLAEELVSLHRDGKPIRLEGEVLVEAQDGGLLLLDREGVLWIIQPDEIDRRGTSAAAFQPFGREELARRLAARMPPGSRIHSTAHYLICYNTTRAYAQWCGALFERLYRGFYNFWTQKGFELHEPDAPLAALVFNGKPAYMAYASGDLGETTASVVRYGYYSLRTNRITTYDLTGVEGVRRPVARVASAATVNRILSQPGAERNVATIVHEATHQLAFNSGLQARYADIPLWTSEGIAIYFETPDLKSSKGWRTIGAVNRFRLAQFRRYLPRRPPDSLRTLISDHTRFRSAQTATDAYAEAWALTYYLLRARSSDYLKYLEMLARKQPLIEDGPAKRIAEFQEFFGDDLAQFDKDFVRYVLRLR